MSATRAIDVIRAGMTGVADFGERGRVDAMATGQGFGGMRRALGAGVLAIVLLGGGDPATAGSLTATAPPDATAAAPMPTLDDIWYRLSDGSATAPAPYTRRTSGTAFTDPTSISGTGTMHTLQEILDAAPVAASAAGDRAAPADICSGQKYFGLRTGSWGAAQVGSRDCTPPTFTQPADTTTLEDTATAPFTLTVSDTGTTDKQNLVWRGASDNAAVLPLDGIAVNCTAATCTATLTPAPGQSGEANVTLTVWDEAGNSVSRTFRLTVSAVNDAPIAVDDSFTVVPFGKLAVGAPGVLANDTDPEGQARTVKATPSCSPSHGTLVLDSDGGFTYENSDGALGTDSCTYTVQDASGATATATLSFVVTDMNPQLAVSLLPATGTCILSGGTCTVAIAASATVTANWFDPTWMRAQITAGGKSGDLLSVSGLPASLGSTVVGGVLYVVGATAASDYETALRSVQLTATNANATPRTITVTVGDGKFSHSDTVAITVSN